MGNAKSGSLLACSPVHGLPIAGRRLHHRHDARLHVRRQRRPSGDDPARSSASTGAATWAASPAASGWFCVSTAPDFAAHNFPDCSKSLAPLLFASTGSNPLGGTSQFSGVLRIMREVCSKALARQGFLFLVAA